MNRIMVRTGFWGILALISFNVAAQEQYGVSFTIEDQGQALSGYFATMGDFSVREEGQDNAYLSVTCSKKGKKPSRTVGSTHAFTGFKMNNEIKANVLQLTIEEHQVIANEKEAERVASSGECIRVQPVTNVLSDHLTLDLNQRDHSEITLKSGKTFSVKVSREP